jgi:hypothetical protein
VGFGVKQRHKMQMDGWQYCQSSIR